MEIREDDPRGDKPASLLREHIEEVTVHSPPGSTYTLEIEALCSPDITFWTAWEKDELLGCGALLELDDQHGEIKSIRTATDHRRQGVASRILRHVIAEAERRSYERLSLETGAQDVYAPARTLYARFDFESCGPFADYEPDPSSVFMTREL